MKPTPMSKITRILLAVIFSLFVHAVPTSGETVSDLDDDAVIRPYGLLKTHSQPDLTPSERENILESEKDLGDASERSMISDLRKAEAEPKKALEKGASDELRGDLNTEGDDLPVEDMPDTITDPLESLNRVFFEFNDRLYFWLLKPVATGYKTVVPEPARVSVRNFFQNLSFPVHFVNCLLQGKVEGAFMEMGRFLLNTVAGAAGFVDVATRSGAFKKYQEDLGQTFGFHGLGPGLYINWPVLGPSSLRDTIGMVGDGFLDPINYVDPTKYRASIKGFQVINQTSLTIGDYEDLKRAALDPYIALRDAYYQNRKSKIKE